MKKLIKMSVSVVIGLLLIALSTSVKAQTFSSLTRSVPTSFSGTLASGGQCEGVIVDYTVTSSGGSTNIVITDEFVTSPCIVPTSYSLVSTVPAGYSFSTPASGGFQMDIASISNSGATVFSVLLQYDRVAAADFTSVQFCSNSAQISNNGVPIVNQTNTDCILLTNNNNWTSDIVCPAMGSYNCYDYTVNISSPPCGSYNLFGNSKHRFSVPAGAIVSPAITISANLTLVSTSIVGGVATVQLVPNNPDQRWDIDETYSLNFNVQYPCDSFATNQSVTPTFSPSICTRGRWVFNPPFSYNWERDCVGPWPGSQCPLPVPNIVLWPKPNQPIPSSSVSHTLPAPFQAATLAVSRQYTSGHDAAGCQNVLNVSLVNQGSMVLNQVVYELDPVPAGITLNCLRGGSSFIQYKTNSSGPWITGTPPSYSAVRALRWAGNEVGADLVCDVNSPSTSGTSSICYTIDPSATVGQSIQTCVSVRYRDSLRCVADSCIAPAFNSYTLNSCATFTVTNLQPAPRITKSMITSMHNPGSPVAFRINVANVGGGNLITNLQDLIDLDLDQVTISSYRYSGPGTGGWVTGPGPSLSPWVTSTNAPFPGNLVDVGIDIPGSCALGGNCCSQEIINQLEIVITARIRPCIQPQTKTNVASLVPQGLNASASYGITNRNQLNAIKLAKGDVTSGYLDEALASPGSNVSYQIKIYNDNPLRWYDPVVVDLLPDAPGRTMCGAGFSSDFKVELTGSPTVTYSNAAMSSNLSYLGYPTFGSHSVSSDPDICGSGSATITSPFSPSANGTFKIKFSGYLECGDTIIIDVPAKIVGTPVTGEESFNHAFINQKVDPTGPYTNPFFADAKIEIEDWNPNCCRDSVEVQWKGEKWKGNTVSTRFDIRNNSLIPVQKVRVSVIDFSYQTEFEDCKKCHHPSQDLATIHASSGNRNLGGLISSQGIYNRERIWDLGAGKMGVSSLSLIAPNPQLPVQTGTPTQITNWTPISLDLGMPETLNIPCCGGCVYVCYKIEVTDVNCNTCVTYICRRIILPKKQMEGNPDACNDNPNADPNPNGGANPNGGSVPSGGGTTICPTCPGGNVIIKDVIDFKKVKKIELSPKGPK